jgi:hypothetical protein
VSFSCVAVQKAAKRVKDEVKPHPSPASPPYTKQYNFKTVSPHQANQYFEALSFVSNLVDDLMQGGSFVA